jgi:hypothetical protein
MKTSVLAILLMFPAGVFAQEAIPAGTILPVLLNTGLSSKDAKPGQMITGRIMQDVPLPDGKIIHAGARVTGHVTEVSPLASGTGSKISFRFDSLVSAKKKMPIRTNLRALASPVEVDGAQLPESGPDRGTPSVAWVTDQIGGETVYRGGGHVMSARQVVGEPVGNGVLARVTASPSSPCRGDVGGNDRPQALWVFSSDACGLYGYSRLTIAHAGRTDPVGVITLSSPHRELKVWNSSGMLLRVN